MVRSAHTQCMERVDRIDRAKSKPVLRHGGYISGRNGRIGKGVWVAKQGESMAAGSMEMQASSVGDDRRRGKRMPWHCLVQVIRKSGTIVPATTENLSSFRDLLPGEGATLSPRRSSTATSSSLSAQVATSDECRIDDYISISP
jgi:hypothetical protein